MEEIKFNNPEDDDSETKNKKESSSKKIRKAAASIGAFLMGKNNQEDESNPNPEKSKRQNAENEATEQSIENLKNEEMLMAERAIVYDSLAKNQENAKFDPNNAVSQSPSYVAVNNFRQKIIEANQTAEEAFRQTIEAISGAETQPAIYEASGEFIDQAAEITTTIVMPVKSDEMLVGPTYAIKIKTEAEHAKEYPWQVYYNGVLGTLEDRKARKEEGQFGGTLDYLIGRRRGRIKSEKKLLPVQKKLEKQLKALRKDIIQKENIIRNTAAEQNNSESSLRVDGNSEQDNSSQRRVVEANQLHGKLPPERIGQVVMNSESTVKKNTEKISSPATENVETLSRADLLELSGKIVIEGSTLRQAYETRLISEKGLRRLVAEHLRGGDIHKALRREFVEKEIDFERDPILRDKDRQSTHRSDNANDSVALKSLLLKLDINAKQEENAELEVMRARSEYQLKEAKSQQKKRNLADGSMAATIIVLIVLVLMLALTRN